MKDIKSLDKLYEKTLDFYDELALYIAAGEAKLADLDAGEIPAKEAEVEAAPEDQRVILAQELRDLRAARDDLERRVHDLKLTRQVTMQSLPSIRLVQENDKSLVTKINSTLVNTVPLWETQLAQAVTIHRSPRGGGRRQGGERPDQRAADQERREPAPGQRRDPHRDGARRLRHRGDREGQRRPDRHDRGQSLRIADEGKAKRAEAEQSLVRMEGELKTALAAAKSGQLGARPSLRDGAAS